MAVTTVAFIAYPVTDVARAVAFYRDVLGLTPSGIEAPFWCEFEIAGTTFGVGNFEQIGAPGSAQSLALEVDDMPAMRAALAQRGTESTEPYETPVCFISVLRDPDGNQVFLHKAKAQ